MKSPKNAGLGLTPAQLDAEAAFKRASVALTGEQQSRKDFDANRERLKALRLAHEAQINEK